jgi:anaerobic selenocysteine-containing dehydrogenase
MAGKSKRMTVVAGYGLQRYTNGGQTIRSILTIPVLTGNIGRQGCGFNFANLQSNIFDEIKEPLSYYPDHEHDKPFRRIISMANFGKDLLSVKDPGIEVAWIERGNPATQLPGSREVVESLKAIPFRIIVEQFLNDTAALADIILPAKGIFEQADAVSSYWNPYVQYKPAIIDPPGEVKPESEIYFLLAGIMNLERGQGDIPSPAEYDRWLEERISRTQGLSLAALMKEPLIPDINEDPAYNDHKFSTPTGRIELWSDEAEKLWHVSPLPAYSPPDDFGESHLPFRLMTPNIASRIHSQFGNLKVIRDVTGEPAWEISITDARRLGVKTGDRIRIYNSRGEITGKARVTAKVKNGSLVFPNGIWINEGGGVNAVITSAATDMGYGAAFHNTRVGIEKVSS